MGPHPPTPPHPTPLHPTPVIGAGGDFHSVQPQAVALRNGHHQVPHRECPAPGLPLLLFGSGKVGGLAAFFREIWRQVGPAAFYRAGLGGTSGDRWNFGRGSVSISGFLVFPFVAFLIFRRETNTTATPRISCQTSQKLVHLHFPQDPCPFSWFPPFFCFFPKDRAFSPHCPCFFLQVRDVELIHLGGLG